MKEKIDFIKEVKNFGRDLGIIFNGAFEEVSSEEEEFYWVYVSEKDNIRSPLGEKGAKYFSNREEDALDFSKECSENYDTFLYSCTAYGGSCPITPKLLEMENYKISQVILHEGLHNHLKPFSSVPYELEEAICMAIQIYGSINFFKENDKKELEKINQYLENTNSFSNIFRNYYFNLKDFYGEGGFEGRERIFDEFGSKIDPFDKKGKTIKENVEAINNAFFVRDIIYYLNWPLVRDSIENLEISDYIENINDYNQGIIQSDSFSKLSYSSTFP